MTHEQFREMLPLYVIGALDGAELAEMEQYVATHRSQCEAELAEFQGVADQLALAAPVAEPSRSAWERIDGEIEAERPPVRPSVRQLPRPASDRFDWSLVFLGWVPWMATAVVCVLLVGATLSRREALQRAADHAADAAQQRTVLMQQNKQITELKSALDNKLHALTQLDQLRESNEAISKEMSALRANNVKLGTEKAELVKTAEELRKKVSKQDLQVSALQQRIDRQGVELNLVMDPAVRVVQMSDPAGKSKVTGKVYWHNTRKTGRVVVSSAPAVEKGGGQCLELWAICGDQPPVPAGLFWTDGAGHGVGEITLAKEVACVSKFAVSIEPAAGVAAPTGLVVLLGQ